MGDLAISRSFGDKDLKRWVTAQPDFRSHWLRDGDEFVLLASDGLWDVLDNQECVFLPVCIPALSV